MQFPQIARIQEFRGAPGRKKADRNPTEWSKGRHLSLFLQKNRETGKLLCAKRRVFWYDTPLIVTSLSGLRRNLDRDRSRTISNFLSQCQHSRPMRPASVLGSREERMLPVLRTCFALESPQRPAGLSGFWLKGRRGCRGFLLAMDFQSADSAILLGNPQNDETPHACWAAGRFCREGSAETSRGHRRAH